MQVNPYRDNHNTFGDFERKEKKRLPEGWVLAFNVKFDDATTTEGNDNPFLEGEHRKVTWYHWPKNDEQRFTEGKYVNGKIVQFGRRGHPIPDGIMAHLTVQGSRKPPKEFPLVQINYTESKTEEAKDDKGKSFQPKKFRHTLRIEFVGSYIDVTIVDGKDTHVWEAGEVVKAFGKEDRLTIYNPAK